MIGLIIVTTLIVMAVFGVSMLASPESYAGQRVVLALRRPFVCQLTGLALTVLAIAGSVAAFIQFTLSNYSE